MGNQTQSVQLTSALYNPDFRDWKIVGEGENYYIWRNSTGTEEIEEYVFTATDMQEFQYMKQVFQFRNQKQYIVSSKYFKENKKDEMCSTFYQGHIFTERIPLRLNEIKDLPYPDSLHLLNSCLLGFKQLYDKVGSFTITDHLIGINSDAKVKVWVNNDFGQPNHEGNISTRNNNEIKMVSQIIQIVDKAIDHKTEPQSLTGFISQGGTPNFSEAINRLTQYSIRYQISIPPILNSIAQLRDLGYFKKMHSKRNTLVQSNNKLNTGLSNTFRASPIPGTIDNMISPINQNVPFPGSQINSQSLVPFNNNTLPSAPTIINRTLPIIANNTTINSLSSNSHQLIPQHPQTILPSSQQNPLLANKIISNTSYGTVSTRKNKTDAFHQLTDIYNSIIKNQTYKSHPLTTIPSQIQLTLTKFTSSDSSDNRIITNFTMNPQKYHSTSPLDSILYHTNELTKNLEEASKINPDIVRRLANQQHFSSNYKNNYLTTPFNNNSSSLEWNQSQGHTDPNLLKGALSIIGKFIDNPNYNSNNNTNYKNSQDNFDSSRRVQDGFTDPSLLAGLKPSSNSSINKTQQQNNKQYNYQPAQGTNSSFLSSMINFSSQPTSTFNNTLQFSNSNSSIGNRKVSFL